MQPQNLENFFKYFIFVSYSLRSIKIKLFKVVFMKDQEFIQKLGKWQNYFKA